MMIGKTGVEIIYLGHAGFLISDKNGRTIAIDPYNVTESGNVKKAGTVLITHGHYDHCSIKDIERVSNDGAIIVVPADCQSKVLKLEGRNLELVETWDKIDLGGGVKVEAFPAYNKYKDYHPKSEGWLGFVIKMGNVIIYHAGDTDLIPEMQRLSGYGKHGNEFVVLLPVCGKQVMNYEEAAEAASLLSPDLAIPMSYGAGLGGSETDADRFLEICKEMNVKAVKLEKI